MKHGPNITETGVELRVWAPERASVTLVLYDEGPRERRRLPMETSSDGFHRATVAHAEPLLYAFAPDGEGPFPDPASRFQPYGVHGPSQVVDPASLRVPGDGFRGRAIEELTIYELHVGTATEEGTFRALIDKLGDIRALGVTAIELMPISDFPGQRNWGYDGVALFAPARCYGTPRDLSELVAAAHARGLAVILDLVLNHLGPSGNYLRAFSPKYFTDRHHTPWGDALDWGAKTNPVGRAFALECAEHWIRDHRIDGLRLDATHAIVDDSEPHLLAELTARVRATAGDRKVVVIAEDERNESKLVREWGLDAVWADDFHHEVRRIVAGDDEGYYRDYQGDLDELVTILRKGWLYEGQHSTVHDRPRGTPALDLPPPAFVHCIQNHDQIGNRARGDRLHHVVEPSRVRAALTLLLSTPYTPLLFMGQEHASSTPFPYFTDHEPDLGRLVTEGRRDEFKHFKSFADPQVRAHIPDPQAEETFTSAKVHWDEAERPPGRDMRALHRALLEIRANEPAMADRSRATFSVERVGNLICVRRGPLLFVVGLREGGSLPLQGRHRVVLDTETFGGSHRARVDDRAVTLLGSGAVVLAR